MTVSKVIQNPEKYLTAASKIFDGHLVEQEIQSLLWKPKVDCHFLNRPTLIPILRHMNQMHAVALHSRSILVYPSI
jgi:hypothetical protein